MSAPPAPPLLLASTSPQRRTILEQLGIPFDVVAPDYEEHDPPGADAVELVKEHALGKARSVADRADGRPVLGVDTAVVLGGRVYGKPANAEAAAEMLDALGGKTHLVVSGLALLTPGLGARRPRRDARHLPAAHPAGRRRVRRERRVGGPGGRVRDPGARRRRWSRRSKGDYLNVVGLPAALLVRVLADRFAGVYGFG